MITRDEVADLREGDVVEYGGHPDLFGATVRGPVRLTSNGLLCVAAYVLRDAGGEPDRYARDRLSLTVVSRAPRPFYVNHPRPEPVPGDVVAPPDGEMEGPVPDWRPTWARSVEGKWIGTHTGQPIVGEMLDHPRLLVDGTTGQVVP